MELYRANIHRSVPARDAVEAREKIEEGVLYGSNPGITMKPDSVELIIPHEDFVRIFRLCRTLMADEAYESDAVTALTQAYAHYLGYRISEQETWDGFVCYAERFADDDDEDIEGWLI